MTREGDPGVCMLKLAHLVISRRKWKVIAAAYRCRDASKKPFVLDQRRLKHNVQALHNNLATRAIYKSSVRVDVVLGGVTDRFELTGKSSRNFRIFSRLRIRKMNY